MTEVLETVMNRVRIVWLQEVSPTAMKSYMSNGASRVAATIILCSEILSAKNDRFLRD